MRKKGPLLLLRRREGWAGGECAWGLAALGTGAAQGTHPLVLRAEVQSQRRVLDCLEDYMTVMMLEGTRAQPGAAFRGIFHLLLEPHLCPQTWRGLTCPRLLPRAGVLWAFAE